MCKRNKKRVEENERKDAFGFSFYIYFVYNPNISDFYPRK